MATVSPSLSFSSICRTNSILSPPPFSCSLTVPLRALRLKSYVCIANSYHKKFPKLTKTRSMADEETLIPEQEEESSTTEEEEESIPISRSDVLTMFLQKATHISPGLKGTCIYLVGINSTMKSSLGKLLADALRYYFFDSDCLVVEAAGGESAANSFSERDEKGFRELETEVLKQLSAMGRLVVSAGDGAVQSTANLALLRHGISIWIDVPLDIVAKEVVEVEIRLSASEISTSGSQSEVLSQLTALYEEMQGGYATADATVSLQSICP